MTILEVRPGGRARHVCCNVTQGLRMDEFFDVVIELKELRKLGAGEERQRRLRRLLADALADVAREAEIVTTQFTCPGFVAEAQTQPWRYGNNSKSLRIGTRVDLPSRSAGALTSPEVRIRG